MGVVDPEPTLAVIAPLDAEDARTAVRVRDWLHNEPEDVSTLLLLERQPGTVLGLARLTHPLDAGEELRRGRRAGESQIADPHAGKGHFAGLGRCGNLAHDVPGLIPYVPT